MAHSPQRHSSWKPCPGVQELSQRLNMIAPRFTPYKSLLWLDASRGAISVFEKRLFLRRDWIKVISADSRKPIVVCNFEWSDELYVAWEV